MQNKVMRINDYSDGDSHWRVACDCSSAEHDVELWFDADSDDIEYGTINLNLSMEVGAYDRVGYQFDKWWDPVRRFYEQIKWRFGVAATVIFKGRYTMMGNVVLDLEGIKGMQLALDEGVKHAKKR